MTTWSDADMVRVRLLWGVEHAQTIGTLADLTGMTRRRVEQALEELSCSGVHPLVAGAKGVFLTSNPAELDRYGDALLQRARSQYRRVRGVRRCARAMRQTVLFPELAA